MIERALVSIAVASLVLAACGTDSPPKAFPGGAMDKAAELERRADAAGVSAGDAKSLADSYGTFGDGFCADGDPELRNDTGSFNAIENPVEAWKFANLVVDVYCPWLSRFPEPVPEPGD